MVLGRGRGWRPAVSSSKPALGLSLTVYVPGASAEKVAVPTPVLVVTVAVMVTPLERVKMKVPSPPVVFLVTTTEDRKSTRLNSSHGSISYAVFCLKDMVLGPD